jgi:TRAP-type C4-dicarboxylate transport system substrate-binding protein
MPFWRKLNPEQQKAALDSGREAGRYMRNLVSKLDQEAVAELKSKGVTVDTIDKKPLVAAMDPVYATLVKNKKTVSEIQAAA